MLEITPRAADALKAAMERTNGQAAGLRITAAQDGCGGPAYSMGLVTGGLDDDRELTTPAGIVVFTDDQSFPLLIGCVLDYGETDNGLAFSFFNPSALTGGAPAPSSGCSCGKGSCSSTPN